MSFACCQLLYPGIMNQVKSLPSTRRGQLYLFGIWRPNTGPQPVPQVPQLAVSELPARLDAKTQRFSGTNVDQQIDHFPPSRPQLGHETSFRRARVDRIDAGGCEELLRYLVDEQRAWRILGIVRIERSLPSICHRSAIHQDLCRDCQAIDAQQRYGRVPLLGQTADQSSDKTSILFIAQQRGSLGALPAAGLQCEEQFKGLANRVWRSLIDDIDRPQGGQPVPVLPQFFSRRP